MRSCWPHRLRHCAAFFILLALQGLLAHPARAWWNGDWPYRMEITADAGPKGANITQPVGRTQILIRLFAGNFDFTSAADDGSDLRVIAGDDKTPLHFHIERYDSLVDQVGLLWVDVPDLAPGATTKLYLYWGNPKATSASDPHGTYAPDQALVYHFADSNGIAHDSTANANTALNAGHRDEAGIVGFGLRLDGTAPIQIPASPSLAMPAGQPMTWSLWFRPNDGVTSGVLYSLRDGDNTLTIGIDKGVAYAQIETASGVVRTSPGPAISAGGWHHIAVTASDHLAVYVDGALRGQAPGALPAMNGVGLLGAAAAAIPPPAPDASTPPAAVAPSPAPANPVPPVPPAAADTTAPQTPPAEAGPPPFVGLIDEFQIAKAVRPVGAFQVAVHSQGPQANLLSFDVAEQDSIFGNGYLGIIIRSVTPDAWVVIGILGMMALSSWAVMIAKVFYINGVTGANRVFREEFAAAKARAAAANHGLETLSAEKRPGLRRSSLFRLYDIGRRELAQRVEAGRIGADGSLSGQSMAAIRSALDAVMVTETQRLNRLMVLLTIAISGGPFLGLLGTVVGVMITFASIAQAGDVNVNAIAPGISAALLATVAGLAVAIPALFGYNYFVTRIRDATAEMQVFLDELMTHMGEGIHLAASKPRVAAE
jgi:biopolymer transport protein ExbB